MIRIRNKMNPSDELIVTRGAYNNLYMKMGYEEVSKKTISKPETTTYKTTIEKQDDKKIIDSKTEKGKE